MCKVWFYFILYVIVYVTLCVCVCMKGGIEEVWRCERENTCVCVCVRACVCVCVGGGGGGKERGCRVLSTSGRGVKQGGNQIACKLAVDYPHPHPYPHPPSSSPHLTSLCKVAHPNLSPLLPAIPSLPGHFQRNPIATASVWVASSRNWSSAAHSKHQLSVDEGNELNSPCASREGRGARASLPHTPRTRPPTPPPPPLPREHRRQVVCYYYYCYNNYYSKNVHRGLYRLFSAQAAIVFGVHALR